MDQASSNQMNNVSVPPVSPQKSSNKTFFIIATLSVLIVIIGTIILLYFLNGKTPTTKISQKSAVKPTPYVPKTSQEKKMATDLRKYGVVCRRFTSLTEALKTPDIACILDLSKTNLNVLPNDITKLTNLNTINVSNNNFTEFPAQLLEIQTLVAIDLSNNKITVAPDVSKLINLQSLILTRNPITNKIEPTAKPPITPILKIIY